jgi:hypothetical protein
MPTKPPLQIMNVILCEDIRQEKNNKFILIGVYLQEIIAAKFPVVVGLTLWIQYASNVPGTVDTKFRVTFNGQKLVDGDIQIQTLDKKSGAFAIPKMPIRLNEPGELLFEMNFGKSWKTLKRMAVSLRDSPTLLPPAA